MSDGPFVHTFTVNPDYLERGVVLKDAWDAADDEFGMDVEPWELSFGIVHVPQWRWVAV